MGPFTDCKDSYPQICPKCKQVMRCVEDHYGGGSHYWVHFCSRCDKRYEYDTYSFELREWLL
jgi:hypothetical protein